MVEVLLFVKKTIAKRRSDLENNDIACLWLKNNPTKGKSV